MKYRFDNEQAKQHFLDIDKIFDDNPNHRIVAYLDKNGLDEFYLVEAEDNPQYFVIESDGPIVELEDFIYHFSDVDVHNYLTLVD